ncbi:hypothetical protein SAMN05421820_101314 [Pedobacter steynii]|uniref:Uncharacterized protein n=1 Tax=Pedobacter steynii TaxID=430522 RepID=A0A1G9JNJ1_9SPHI|nr:hypothetical protein SAMN05421820_101314 [Pedobacter steynii]
MVIVELTAIVLLKRLLYLTKFYPGEFETLGYKFYNH